MFKQWLARIGALILLGLICFGFWAYYRGDFDLSFVDREALKQNGGGVADPKGEDDSTPPEILDPPTTDDQSSLPNDGNISHVVDLPQGGGSDKTPGDGEDTLQQPVSVLPTLGLVSEYAAQNYVRTDAVYDKEIHVMAQLSSEALALTDTYSFRQKTVAVPVRTYPSLDREYVIVYEDRVLARPAVQMYMGYILYDNGEEIWLTTPEGEALLIMDGTIEPAWTRDKKDRPVFVSQTTTEESEIQKTYWVLSEEGTFVKSDYNEAADNRGLYYDYPSYFGVNREEDVPKLYTTKNQDPAYRYYSHTYTRYRYAYAYSDGYAFVVNDAEEASILNLRGRSAFKTRVFITERLNDRTRYVMAFYTMPETFGEESIGFFYFDHGLMRVREQSVDSQSYYYEEVQDRVVLYDKDRLIRTDGTDFPLPAGYRVVSYSDGIILLEKEGKYGYMDYTGAWIAQPIFSYATPFREGLGILTLPDGKKGMIDREGDVVLPFVYTDIAKPSGGVVAAYTESDGWVIYHKMVKEASSEAENA